MLIAQQESPVLTPHLFPYVRSNSFLLLLHCRSLPSFISLLLPFPPEGRTRDRSKKKGRRKREPPLSHFFHSSDSLPFYYDFVVVRSLPYQYLSSHSSSSPTTLVLSIHVCVCAYHLCERVNCEQEKQIQYVRRVTTAAGCYITCVRVCVCVLSLRLLGVTRRGNPKPRCC